MLLSITLHGKIKVLSVNHAKRKGHNVKKPAQEKKKEKLTVRAHWLSERTNPLLWWHLKTQNNIFGCWRVEKKCFLSPVYGRQEHRTFYGCWIQTEGLKLLLPQRHAFHLAEVVEQSLGAAASTGEEETLAVRSQLTNYLISSVKKFNGWIPLQVADDQLLDAGVGRLDGLAKLFKTLRRKKRYFIYRFFFLNNALYWLTIIYIADCSHLDSQLVHKKSL